MIWFGPTGASFLSSGTVLYCNTYTTVLYTLYHCTVYPIPLYCISYTTVLYILYHCTVYPIPLYCILYTSVLGK